MDWICGSIMGVAIIITILWVSIQIAKIDEMNGNK